MSFYINNPAVTKSILLKMNKQEFVIQAQIIKTILLEFELTERNANQRFMYLNLFIWCRSVYKKKFAS